MRKDVLVLLGATIIIILIGLGIYYFVFVVKRTTSTGWEPPTKNPPTKQIGVSIEVPEGWKGPPPNSEVSPQ